MHNKDSLSRKQTYRNYVLLLVEGILFTVGMVFFDTNTILPLLMKELTGSVIMVGFIGTAPALGMGLTSLLAGNWVKSYKYKKKFMVTVSSLGRLPLWILGLSLIFISLDNVYFWGTMIIGIQFLFWLADGAVYSAWSDLMGKSINASNRGRFLGVTQIAGGIIAIIAGGFVNRLIDLEFLAFPANYGLILCIGALLFTLSILAFSGVIEKPSST
ncbi:MAG: MFS transporter, partial [Halanaerobiales bacterium]